MKLTQIFSAIALVSLLALPAYAGKKPAADKAATTSSQAATSQIDINTASKSELETLPGIGDALADKIISGRPYRAKNQLVQKKVIPGATYAKISDKIIAKQSK